MKDESKTREELIEELKRLRHRVAGLEAAQAPRGPKEEWSATFDAISDGVCLLDPKGKILRCNAAMARLLGKPSPDIIGRRCCELMHGTRNPIVGCPIVRMQESRKRETLTLKVDDRSLNVIADPVLDEAGCLTGAVHIIADVTARKKAEEALREREEQYRLLFESAPVSITLVGLNGIVLDCNPAAERVAGIPREEIIGKHFTKLGVLNARDLPGYVKLLSALVAGKDSGPAALRVTGNDGEARWLEAFPSLLRRGGKLHAVQVIARDITEEKLVEEQRKSYVRDLEFLSKTAMAFSELPADADIYGFTAERLRELVGEAIILVNSYDAAKDTVCIRAVAGLGKSVRKLFKIVGRNPVGMVFSLDDMAREGLRKGQLIQVPGGVYEWTFQRVPQGICHAVERAVGLGDMHAMGFVREGQLFGNVSLVMRKGATLRNTDIIEAFVNQASIALQRRKAEEALRQSEEKWRSLVENAPDIIITLDPDGTILFINRTVSGLTPDKSIGTSVYDYVPPEFHETMRKSFQTVVQTGEAAGYEVAGVGADGTTSWYFSRVGPIKHHRKVVGLTLIAADITESKKAEEEKRSLQEQLAQAQKMEALGTLAGGIAHEFNNINAVIIGYADLTLQTEGLSDLARRNLETVRASATRGANLTRSLLVFSRKDVGEKKPVILRDVVEEVLQMTATEFASEGIEISVTHSANVPPVMADASMLESVVMNLVINARHAMLRSKVKKLTIRTGQKKASAFIEVEDTGCGIPEENLHRIFDPFFTTKGSLASGEVFDGKARGTGLGLSVCHGIVEAHGGEIKVRSQVGKGTTFTVYLPAASPRKTARREAQEVRPAGATRIMVVDDEEPITSLLVDILGHAGYEADGFTDPQEAARALQQGAYSLAFVDLQMPQMRGEDFIKLVSALPVERRPLSVVVTGRLDVLEERCHDPAVVATLPKPFETKQVIEIVRENLAKRAGLEKKELS
ncbi:MAG: PAS domain S-box protein [bacterium]|nr:PAS domain S-box protein [bacterium]